MFLALKLQLQEGILNLFLEGVVVVVVVVISQIILHHEGILSLFLIGVVVVALVVVAVVRIMWLFLLFFTGAKALQKINLGDYFCSAIFEILKM